MALGPVVAMNTFTLNYFYKIDQTNAYYEAHSDALLLPSDYTMVNDTYLMYQFADWLMVGGNFWMLNVPSSGYLTQRLTGVALFTPKVEGFHSVYAALMCGTFLKDHYYAGKFYIGGQAGFTLKL